LSPFSKRAPELNGLDACMKSARKFASQTDSHATFNNWGKAKDDEIIDYIYYSGFSSCLEYQTITRKYDNRKFISDHYPITARLIF
jgi:endonuclease/exonuclease/phosphatase family metal-dependent hydrolase